MQATQTRPPVATPRSPQSPAPAPEAVTGLEHLPRLGVVTKDRNSTLLLYASVMLLVDAGANILWGLIGLVHDVHVAAGTPFAGSFSTWAWIWIGFGVVEIFTAFAIAYRSAFAILVGILIAGLSALGHMLAVGKYPVWGAAALVINLSVVAALVAVWRRPSGSVRL